MSDQQNMEAGKRNDLIHGERVGIVENINNPPANRQMCAQVRVYGVFSDKVPVSELPWAEYKLPLGANINRGNFTPVQVGDLVWVDFPYNGDTRRPRMTGSVHHTPGNIPNLPHETFAGLDVHQHKRVADEPIPAGHTYHEDEASTLHGVTIERNKDGSYAIYQRSSGTELTITADGHMIFHVEGDIYRSASGNSIANIAGNETEAIGGHQITTATGGIDHDGNNSKALKGNRNGHHICALTRKPVAHISASVKSTT